MSVSNARLTDVDRELERLGSNEAIARGEAVAANGGPLDLASVDGELERLGVGVPARPTTVVSAPAPSAPLSASVAPASVAPAALDVASLFDDAASTDVASLLDDAHAEPRTRTGPGSDASIDLAALLEGEDILDDSEIELEDE